MRWKKCFTVVGCHAAGEVGNVITGGVIDVPGKTMFEKMEYLETRADDIRKLTLFEPRGAPYVNANLILPACDPSADFGFVILESTEYPPMSGANAICVATVALETGIVEMQEPVTTLRMEAPGGVIECKCTCDNGKATEIEFTNIPCFVYELDKQVEVEGLGTVTVDTAFGGMNYAYVDAAALGFSLKPEEARELCAVGLKIKAAVNEQLQTVHPENGKISGVSNVVFQGPVIRSGNTLESQSATVVLHGRIDRSPCGTGTSGRVAVLHAKGVLKEGECLKHISLAGTSFVATVKHTTKVAGRDAIVPTVAGQAWITSMGQYGLDPTDPYPQGHILSDVWF
ncbi:proline racemase family protein [Ensifer sp. SSB1]|uniref:proline racemase family protein n=1 Tax=Ensifer sp. SSB1 TaxID=2795385 RepID=UPI001A3DCDB4|nr:proline racemase family protein [Ensifer sp. SSB1]MBK5567081.1 proline racemase family protein [Ensifer sp. SSB1]